MIVVCTSVYLTNDSLKTCAPNQRSHTLCSCVIRQSMQWRSLNCAKTMCGCGAWTILSSAWYLSHSLFLTEQQLAITQCYSWCYITETLYAAVYIQWKLGPRTGSYLVLSSGLYRVDAWLHTVHSHSLPSHHRLRLICHVSFTTHADITCRTT